MEGVTVTTRAGERSARGAAAPVQRTRIAFRSVNQPGTPGHRQGMQRHHVLPRQLLGKSCFSRLLDTVGRDRAGIDDFRTNGLLLPSLEQAAQVLGLPLHRGPHTRYNEVVMERLGQIEAGWQQHRLRNSEHAAQDVLMRMRLLQQALRRSLLKPAMRFCRLNRRDPLWQEPDFADLDAMADLLWAASAPPVSGEGGPHPLGQASHG